MKYAIAIFGLVACLVVSLAWGKFSGMEGATFEAEGDIWTVQLESRLNYKAQVRPKGNLFQYNERSYRETPTQNIPPEDDNLIVTSESGQTGYALHAWMVSIDRLELGPLWIILNDQDIPFARCWLTNDPQMEFVCTGLAVNGTLTRRDKLYVEESPPGPFDHPQ